MADDQQGLVQHPSAEFVVAPGATSDPHPLVSWLLQTGFALGGRVLYRIEAILPPDYALNGGTLIVSNHLRDSDVPILTLALCQGSGLSFRFAPPFFASREDLLRPGALSALTIDWPWPFPSLLGAIPLAWLFRIGHAKPIRRVREFTLREAIAALKKAGLENARIADVLNARGLRELGVKNRDQPLRTVRDGRRASADHCWGLRRLRREAFSIATCGFRAEVDLQLHDFASLLDAGHCLYLAPEGHTSDDGRFQRVREGAWRICRLTARRHPLLPVALSYDALAPGRPRVVIRAGTPRCDLDASSVRGFRAVLRQAIQRLCVVNASHLIARYLVSGPMCFTTSELGDWMQAAADAVGAAGFMRDRLLLEPSLDALAEDRLRWLAGKGIVARVAAHWRNVWPRDSPPGWGKPVNALPYLANSLSDLSGDLDRTLGR